MLTSSFDTLVQLPDADLRTALRRMPNEELRDLLKACLRVTAHHLRVAAFMYGELLSRGIELRALVNGLGPILKDISAGRLVPEAGQVFFARPATLALLHKVSLAEQRELADGREIEVATRTETGGFEVTKQSLAECTHDQARLVLGPSGVRSLAEQRRVLQNTGRVTARAHNDAGLAVKVHADPAHGVLRVGTITIAPVDLMPALAALGYKLVRLRVAEAA